MGYPPPPLPICGCEVVDVLAVADFVSVAVLVVSAVVATVFGRRRIVSYSKIFLTQFVLSRQAVSLPTKKDCSCYGHTRNVHLFPTNT